MSNTSTKANHLGASHIQTMFGSIAKHYDFLNHLLSANRDRFWRRHAVEKSGVTAGERVLDICAGTGDLAFEFKNKTDHVFAMDFCLPMLRRARSKGHLPIAAADSLCLPVGDDHFDVVSIAFGIRNVVNFENCLKEVRRVLKTNGRIVILEFTEPPGAIFSSLYRFYLNKMLPLIAACFSEQSAYRYLPESVSEFPDAPQFSAILKNVGYQNVTFDYLTCGIVAMHLGYKR